MQKYSTLYLPVLKSSVESIWSVHWCHILQLGSTSSSCGFPFNQYQLCRGPGRSEPSWQLPNTTLVLASFAVCYRKLVGGFSEANRRKLCCFTSYLVRLYWAGGFNRRKKLHDCGLEVFMLKRLLSAHLNVLSVLITVWSITLQCAAGIQPPSVGRLKPAKYTTGQQTFG